MQRLLHFVQNWPLLSYFTPSFTPRGANSEGQQGMQGCPLPGAGNRCWSPGRPLAVPLKFKQNFPDDQLGSWGGLASCVFPALTL